MKAQIYTLNQNPSLFAHKLFFITFLACFALISSCSRPKAKHVPYQEFTLPEFQSEINPMSLLEQEKVRRFTGSILVWNNQLSRESAEEFLSASKESVDLEVERLDFIKNKILPLSVNFDNAIADQEAARNDSALAVRSASLKAAREFHARVKSTIFDGALVTDQTYENDFDQTFALYCDALLFSRVANVSFLERSYKKRPIWSGVCETYYEQSELMAPSAQSCADQPQGSNYFRCMWTDGVLKSNLMKSLYSEESIKKIAMIDPDLIASAENFNRVGVNHFLALNRNYKIKDSNSNVVAEIPAPDLKDDTEPGADLRKIRNKRSVFGIISDFESGRLLPQVSKVSTVTESNIKHWRGVLAANSNRSSSVLGNSEQLYNDYYRVKNDNDLNVEIKYVDDFEALRIQERQIFDPILDPEATARIASTADRLSEIVGEAKTLLNILRPSNQCEDISYSFYSDLGCRYDRAFQKQLNVAAKPQVSDALFNGVQVKIERVQSSSENGPVIKVDFTFNKSAPKSFISCYAVSRSSQVACDNEPNAKFFPVFEIDANTGSMHFVIAIEDDADVGLGYVARENNANFNELKDLSGKYFDISMYPNRLEGMHDIFSGSVKILRDLGDTDYVSFGNLSLRDDEPAYRSVQVKFETEIDARE